MAEGGPRRRTLARHGRLRSPGPVRQLLRLLGVAATVVVVSTVGVAAYAAYDFSSVFASNAVEFERPGQPVPDLGELGNEGVSILFAGLDACEEAYKLRFPGRCDPDVTYDDETREDKRNDVNMVMHISPEPRRVTVISFPRDLMIPVPECTTPEGGVVPAADRVQLNAVYSRGDITCVAETLSSLTGLDIGYAASIKWGGVIEITNAIGGVEVCVAGKGIHDLKNTNLSLEPGMHTLVGQEALEFLRTREGVGDGSDLGRISNQQVYMSALVRKLASAEVLTNPATLLRLARTTLSNVRPTSTMTAPVALARIGLAAKDVPLSEYTFVLYPVLDDPYDTNRVIPNQAVADELFAAIEANAPVQPEGPGGGATLAEEPDGDGGEPGADAPDADAAPPAGDGPAPGEDPTPGEATQDPGMTGLFGTNAEQSTCSKGRQG